MGTDGTVVELDLRCRLGGRRPLRRVSFRTRCRLGAARDLGAPDRLALEVRGARGADRGASPLAFLLLALVLAGIGVGRWREGRKLLVPAAIIVAMGGTEAVLWRLFADGGRYPFSWEELLAACVFCLLGAALTWRVEGARPLRWLFVVYLGACLAAFAIPSSLGENVDRLRYVAVPVAVLALSLRHWRPLPVAVVSLGLAASWNLTPLAFSFVNTLSGPRFGAVLLASGDRLPPPTPESVLPGRGGRHGRPLGRRLPASRRHSAGQRLVPPERLPPEPPPLQRRRVRPKRVSALAPLARRSLCRPHRCAAGLQRSRRGEAVEDRQVRADEGTQDAARDHLRGTVPTPVDHRACPRQRGQLDRVPGDCASRRGGDVPARDPLLAVLDGLDRLPRSRAGLDDPAADTRGGHREAEHPRQRAARAGCFSGRAASDL